MTTLRQRLSKLETARPHMARPLAIVIMPCGEDDAITALVCGEIRVDRFAGEFLDTLQVRAERLHPGEVRIWASLTEPCELAHAPSESLQEVVEGEGKGESKPTGRKKTNDGGCR